MMHNLPAVKSIVIDERLLEFSATLIEKHMIFMHKFLF